jgi:hypothetical protein
MSADLHTDAMYITNMADVKIVVGAWMSVYSPITGEYRFSGEIVAIYLGVAPEYEAGNEVHIVDKEMGIDKIVPADYIG